MDCSYYVYMHQDKNKNVFYIGKGKLPGTGRSYRHLSWEGKSDDWNNIAKEGYTSQILTYGSERDMLYLESNLIKSLTKSGVKLVNKYFNEEFTSVRKGITFQNWKSDKSTDLYKQKRKQQRIDFYKQKEAA